MSSLAVPHLEAAPLVEAGAHAATFRAGPRWLQPLQITLAVGLAYYAASIVGLSMRVPPATTSLIWPPNALLTSVLLLAPYRYWWACFLGAFLSHVVVQQGVGWPLGLIGLLFLTNCSEAIIGAVGLRAVSDEPTRFDTLKRVVAFVAVVCLAAPILSSFADAAVVQAMTGVPFWPTWRTRTFSNILTALSVVPVIVLGWNAVRTGAPGVGLTRVTEILVISAASIVGALVVFNPHAAIEIPGLGSNPTVLLLPLLFWAGVRFGVGGVSTVMLIYAMLACQAAIAGRRPFEWLPPSESVSALQVYLAIMALPMMFVAALLDERRQATRHLSERLRFEELLSQASGRFVSLPSDAMERAFTDRLKEIGAFLKVDAVALVEHVEEGGPAPWRLHAWQLPDRQPPWWALTCSGLPWAVDRLSAGLPICFTSPDDLPAHASVERQLVADLGLTSALILPVMAGRRLHGALSVATRHVSRAWTTSDVAQLQLLAEVFASALARKRSEDRLRSSETTKSAILASLSSQIAVFDRHGQIIAVNEAWRAACPADFAPDPDTADDPARASVPPRHSVLSEACFGPWLHGLDDVLEGRSDSFTAEYVSGSGADERWHAVSIVPLNRVDGGAVVSLSDVSGRKRMEIEAREAHRELAHVSRLSAMGELAASLAHEINQPLAGILTNAQAARRLLGLPTPPQAQVDEAIQDIEDDSRRAGHIIKRVREMMSRGSEVPELVDLNGILREVEVLIRSDAVIRGIAVRFEPFREAASVLGNRIDLQQVLLNLVMNAMDAVDGSDSPGRQVTVSTGRADGRVVIRVIDNGVGLVPGTEHRIFEPFFTTKARGMGVGLSLARSIVERHGGRISAESTAGRGTSFTIGLPAGGGPLT
jgi:signal transduction histidine kinase/integral membrane sensor domain MASE1